MMRQISVSFPTSLPVTDQQIDISHISERQKAFYLNLLGEIASIYEGKKKARVVIGVAGPTGAGKSVVTVLLKEISKQVDLPFVIETVTIDAYHFRNEYLLSHFSGGAPLKKVKGRFDTYDPLALLNDLQNFSGGKAVSFPAYSRKLHDPVKDALRVEAPNALLLVEGLWLLFDRGGWEKIGPVLDYSIFIDADPDKTKGPVLERHIRGGRNLEDAKRHYESVDGKNAGLVLETKARANRVIPAYYALG